MNSAAAAARAPAALTDDRPCFDVDDSWRDRRPFSAKSRREATSVHCDRREDLGTTFWSLPTSRIYTTRGDRRRLVHDVDFLCPFRCAVGVLVALTSERGALSMKTKVSALQPRQHHRAIYGYGDKQCFDCWTSWNLGVIDACELYDCFPFLNGRGKTTHRRASGLTDEWRMNSKTESCSCV